VTYRLSCITLILVGVLGCRLWFGTSAITPARRPLELFPAQLGEWQEVREAKLPAGTAQVLRADDYLSRVYQNRSGNHVQLFIAYFSAQRAGESMHSPKNCLPGGGWQPILDDKVTADLGTGKPETITRYIVERAGMRMLVLYWYQAHGRIIADEYRSKFYLVWDAIRLHRRDGAIVRLVVPMDADQDPEQMNALALRFAHQASQCLPQFLPN
jgi:EpsI family protein